MISMEISVQAQDPEQSDPDESAAQALVPQSPARHEAQYGTQPGSPEASGGHVAYGTGYGRGNYRDRQSSRHIASRSKTRKIRKLTALVALLLIALVTTSMGWILAWAKLELLESENLTLDVKLRQTSDQLQSFKARALERETALQAMVEKRIPGLLPLEYNKLFELNDKYVVSVTFTRSGVAESKAVEYHALLRNNSTNMIAPHVKIFLFDELGVQSGSAVIKKDDATGGVDIAELRPGETRSYNAKVQVDREAKPKFFLVQVD
jgi:hypothetical protein